MTLREKTEKLRKETEKTQLSTPSEPTIDTPSNQPGESLTSLKRLAIKGSIWVMIGFGTTQVLRVIGNVILTRLLSPEAFGTMAIVNALLVGLEMFSDLGLRPNIIQSKRGEEPTFLRTAWTIQIIRGFILALFAAALAWPLAMMNNQPDLVLITIVAGLSSIITGFHSTSLLVYSRRMLLRQLVILGLVVYTFSLITMVTWAWFFPSVWALIIGTFVGSFLKLIASHKILPGISMRLQWEPVAVRELIRFGRWIFIGTAITFLANRLDIFILGRFAGLEMLGIYVLAKNLSLMVVQGLRKLSSTILLPVYSRLAELGAHTLRHRMFKVRAILLAVALPPFWILILGGDYLIGFLYDDRYQDAGWMLQVMATGATAIAIRITIGPVLLAVGDSFRSMIYTLIGLGLQIVGMSIGAWLGGLTGFLVGISVAELLGYFVLIYLIRPYGVWLPLLDAAAFGSSLIVIGIAFWLH